MRAKSYADPNVWDVQMRLWSRFFIVEIISLIFSYQLYQLSPLKPCSCHRTTLWSIWIYVTIMANIKHWTVNSWTRLMRPSPKMQHVSSTTISPPVRFKPALARILCPYVWVCQTLFYPLTLLVHWQFCLNIYFFETFLLPNHAIPTSQMFFNFCTRKSLKNPDSMSANLNADKRCI